jgi:hypothetical protein
MNATHPMEQGTQDTLLDRTVSAMVEAMLEADSSDTWISQMARLTLAHLAAELIVLEELAGQPLTLQDACRFLCAGAEDKL